MLTAKPWPMSHTVIRTSPGNGLGGRYSKKPANISQASGFGRGHLAVVWFGRRVVMVRLVALAGTRLENRRAGAMGGYADDGGAGWRAFFRYSAAQPLGKRAGDSVVFLGINPVGAVGFFFAVLSLAVVSRAFGAIHHECAVLVDALRAGMGRSSSAVAIVVAGDRGGIGDFAAARFGLKTAGLADIGRFFAVSTA